MKHYYTIALMVAALLQTGCFKQDYSDCPVTENLILKFDLRSNDGTSLFTEKVSSIDVFVYDVSNRPAAHRRVTKEEQDCIGNLSFTVDPGIYHIVCWANIGEETRIVGPAGDWPLEDCYLKTVSAQTSSPLYYAPADGDCGAVVFPNKITTKEMFFVRAHRTIKVYLKDYEAVHETTAPVINFSNMPVCSDFLMQIGTLRKTYEALASSVIAGDGPRMMASFNFLIASFDEDILIEVIKASTGEIITEVNLKQYVDVHATKIDDLNEFGIEIRYLVNGSVEITFIGWTDIPLEPEW